MSNIKKITIYMENKLSEHLTEFQELTCTTRNALFTHFITRQIIEFNNDKIFFVKCFRKYNYIPNGKGKSERVTLKETMNKELLVFYYRIAELLLEYDEYITYEQFIYVLIKKTYTEIFYNINYSTIASGIKKTDSTKENRKTAIAFLKNIMPTLTIKQVDGDIEYKENIWVCILDVISKKMGLSKKDFMEFLVIEYMIANKGVLELYQNIK